MNNMTTSNHASISNARVLDDGDGITVYYYTGNKSVEAGNPYIRFDRETMTTTINEVNCRVDVATPDGITEDSTVADDIAALIELADETVEANEFDAHLENNS